MEQLTIKHLGRRLAYGLKAANLNVSRFGLDKPLIKDIEASNIMTLTDFAPTYKPILRDLSCLTKEITHNGETFVPLVRIAEMMGLRYLSLDVLENSVDFILNPSYRRPNTKTKENRKVRFWLNTFKSFSFNCTDGGLMRSFDQLKGFELLLSWHFCIDEPEGTWIDVNSLPKNPYE